jgi:hypothetical protein
VSWIIPPSLITIYPSDDEETAVKITSVDRSSFPRTMKELPTYLVVSAISLRTPAELVCVVPYGNNQPRAALAAGFIEMVVIVMVGETLRDRPYWVGVREGIPVGRLVG